MRPQRPRQRPHRLVVVVIVVEVCCGGCSVVIIATSHVELDDISRIRGTVNIIGLSRQARGHLQKKSSGGKPYGAASYLTSVGGGGRLRALSMDTKARTINY